MIRKFVDPGAFKLMAIDAGTIPTGGWKRLSSTVTKPSDVSRTMNLTPSWLLKGAKIPVDPGAFTVKP